MKFDLDAMLHNEDGAVTVDWVVLTAAIVGLGLAVLVPIWGGSSSLAADVGGSISGVAVGWQTN